MKFERANGHGACEVHLLVRSTYHMYPQDYGYCARRAGWWIDGIMLCNSHKRALERLLMAKHE